MEFMAAREGASSARRRRDRQLRAWHRHVRTTVAMELSTALHHSAQGLKKRVVEEPREEELPVEHKATSGQIDDDDDDDDNDNDNDNDDDDDDNNNMRGV